MSERYRIIMADPPWRYRDSSRSRIGAERHYGTLALPQLMSLPVYDMAADDSVLFMWATYPMRLEALRLLEAWGYAYKTVAFVWIKLTRDGGSPTWGGGRYTRSNAEECLLGVRGRGLRRCRADVHQVIFAARGAHSAKPPEARRRVEQLYDVMPRLELFARERAEGWDRWGTEAPEGQGLIRRLGWGPW